MEWTPSETLARSDSGCEQIPWMRIHEKLTFLCYVIKPQRAPFGPPSSSADRQHEPIPAPAAAADADQRAASLRAVGSVFVNLRHHASPRGDTGARKKPAPQYGAPRRAILSFSPFTIMLLWHSSHVSKPLCRGQPLSHSVIFTRLLCRPRSPACTSCPRRPDAHYRSACHCCCVWHVWRALPMFA